MHMRYKIGVMPFGRVFTVPCAAENYIKVADPKFCKVLIALMCTDTDIADTDELAARCGLTPSEAEDAVIFWSTYGVISAAPENGEPIKQVTAEPQPVQTAEPVPQAQPVVLTEAIDPMKNTAAAKSTVRYSPKDLAQKARENTELATLYEEVQKIFGRTINTTETAGFVNLYEYYGFSVPSILILTRFAHEHGKDRIAYIESVAKDWHSRGIVEYGAVEAEIIRQTEANRIDEKLKRVLGIEGSLTKKQLEYFARWREWGFDVETIDLAGQRCREKKNRFELGYTNGILKRWQEEKLMSVEAVIASELRFEQERTDNARSDTSYDVSGWEDMALTLDPSLLGTEEGNR
ncbi:DnaD and phage-associated domain-containing protein [Ruminococcus sp. YE71]|nr:DnaD and phage-associated domain-containing protein [Ruminococcus sp. YE78]SFW27002.1 DnaD and phage-associated domain-containing protein [Ruminococcus sp. YE71]